MPSGGITPDGQWQKPKHGNPHFLYPVAAMRQFFKAFFLKQMRLALEGGVRTLPPDFPANPKAYYNWKELLYQKQWVIYTKKPFQGVQNVVKYLARYSHRVAIANHRLHPVDEHQVHFQYKDYADKTQKKVMVLKGIDFLKRFCLHILPPRFRKVRQLGFFANACKAKSLAKARKALNSKQAQLLNRAYPPTAPHLVILHM